ncbi:MAG: hypothetical protein ABR599_03275 [Gemmatimonadota bacterium]
MSGRSHTPRAPAGAGARLALVALLAAACAPDEESAWPTRNYTGTYAVRARVSANECEAPVFGSADTLLLEVSHAVDNRASVRVSPVVLVRGEFRGDRLEASSAVAAPPGTQSADGAGARAPDSVRYRVVFEFDGEELAGDYHVAQPAVGALRACSQSFELEGHQVQRRPAPAMPAD